MNNSEVIAPIALVISALSLAVSCWGTFRDRVRLKITTTYYTGEYDNGKPSIAIRVVNTGRRIAVLTMFGGNLADGGWQGEGLKSAEGGLHLAESEFYSRTFRPEDIIAISPDSESKYVSLWFEDSHGVRHEVPGSTKLIERLAESLPEEDDD